MSEITKKIENIYDNRLFKNLYTFILSGITIILLIIIPFMINRNIISTIWFDFIVRIFITYSFCNLFHFVSHLDQYYSKFYGDKITLVTSKPDTFKQTVNIISSVFVGCVGYFFYKSTISFFIPNIGDIGPILSIIIGLLLFLPLLSQFQKRWLNFQYLNNHLNTSMIHENTNHHLCFSFEN